MQGPSGTQEDRVELPAHSPLGASSAKRWMACPGSTTLLKLLAAAPHSDEPEDEEWRVDGSQAHELASYCLNAGIDTWEADPALYPALTANMMGAVQVYINHVLKVTGPGRLVEFRLHRPEFHDLCFGTVDCSENGEDHLHVIDYKHGMGVVVEVVENEQLMYYAFMVIDEMGETNDDKPVTLTIVQPRVPWHPDGVVRSWTTTVGYIRQWAYSVLLPAMHRTATEQYLTTGEHCRFCPAKRLCPGFLGVANRYRHLTLEDVKGMTDETLSACLEDIAVIRMAPKMLMDEARHRSINAGAAIPGWKLVHTTADRVWKTEAPVGERFGFQPQKVKSPAQVEAEPGGKAFVHEWAFAPDAGYELVPETDRRKAVVIEKSQETFKKYLDSHKEKA